MRKRIIVLSLLALTASVRALEVPHGQAAVVEAVIGKAERVDAKGVQALTVGEALSFGDRVVTGENGRVFLRLADQAVTRLAANTELSLDEPGKRQGTFLSLAKGWARFLVGQRAPGAAFEVSTRNSVAAVKGTDMEVGDDGDTHARVWGSEHHPALSFSDPKSGKGLDLDAGQGVDYNGKEFKLLEHLVKDLLREQDRRYHGLPEPTPVAAPDNGGANGTPAAPGPQTTPPPTDGGHHSQLDALLRDAIQHAVADVQRDIRLDNLQNQQERGSDLAAGRIGYDSNGYQVQISNYVTRPDAETVVLTTIDSRTAGPDAGQSLASERTTWNAPLPGDWLSVAKRGLNDPANIDPNTGWANYYRVRQSFVATNSATFDPVTQGFAVLGDAVQSVTLFDAPFFVGAVGPGNPLFQTWSQSVSLVTPGGEGPNTLYLSYYSLVDQGLTLDPVTGHAYDPGSTLADMVVGSELKVTDQFGCACYGPNPTVAVSFNGNQATYTYSDNATYYSLQETVQLIDSLGVVQPLPGSVLNSSNPLPSDFKGAPGTLNLEVIFDAPGDGDFFSRPIDLLFMPQVYDLMNMVVFPPQAPVVAPPPPLY